MVGPSRGLPRCGGCIPRKDWTGEGWGVVCSEWDGLVGNLDMGKMPSEPLCSPWPDHERSEVGSSWW